MNIKNISPKKHIVISQQFSIEYLGELFNLVLDIKENKEKYKDILSGKIIATLFYEASTRTRFSFESAILKLGGKIISTENASKFSSAKKGETIGDTIQMLNSYSDMIILRHYENNIFNDILNVIKIPYINAGSGTSQHPTQSLLDVFTIYEKFRNLENKKICLVGDLLRGRTCDSLIYILSKYKNNTFYFISPKNSKIKNSLREHLIENKIKFYETENLNTTLKKVDVCYMTRIQKERFDKIEEYEKARGKYILTNENVNSMKKSSIVLHPLPRVDEIRNEVDKNPRAYYFKQAENGLYVRMAILKLLNDNLT